MHEIKSIFDGWELQCFGAGVSGDFTCAYGYVDRNRHHGGPWTADLPQFQAVGRYLQQHFDLPHFRIDSEGFRWRPIREAFDAVVYANDVLRLSPDQFREIDRLAQIAEGMASVQQLVDSADMLPELTEGTVAESVEVSA